MPQLSPTTSKVMQNVFRIFAWQPGRGGQNVAVWILIIGLGLPTACRGSSATIQPPDTVGELVTPTLIGNEASTEILPDPTNTPEPVSPTPRPTGTSTPLPTATPSPTSTSTSTPTPTPSPTPTPALRQLTSGGCCVQPFFSPDSQQVLFIDRPDPEAAAGIYGIDLANPQESPKLVHGTIGFRSPDRTIVATIEGKLARFLDESTGQSWAIDTGGNWPRYSPDNTQILWSATDREGPYDRRRSDIWLAPLEGGEPRLLLSVTGGSLVGWFPDGRHILLIDRENPDEEERTLLVYDLADERRMNIAREKRLRGLEVSPGGNWIAYFLTFAEDPERNGIWIARSDGSEQFKLDVPGFGAYRWRDETTLLFIPMRSSSQESMRLWAVDIDTNRSQPLTDPASLPFSISNGDWEVSADGQHVVFVNSRDQNIWLITLP